MRRGLAFDQPSGQQGLLEKFSAIHRGPSTIGVSVRTSGIQPQARLGRYTYLSIAHPYWLLARTSSLASSCGKRAREHTHAMATRSQTSAANSRMPITPHDMLMGKMPPRMPEFNLEEAIKDFISQDGANCRQSLPSPPRSPPPPPSPPAVLAPSPVFSQVSRPPYPPLFPLAHLPHAQL